MSPVKEKAIQMIQSLPDDSTYEDIQYHLFVLEKVAKGMKAIEEGRVISHKEAKKKVMEWLRSYCCA